MTETIFAPIASFLISSIYEGFLLLGWSRGVAKLIKLCSMPAQTIETNLDSIEPSLIFTTYMRGFYPRGGGGVAQLKKIT